MKYSIAYNFDKKMINYYKKINKKNDFIFQVFFSSKEGYLGGGRYQGLPSSSLKKTEEHFKYLRDKVETNYLLNSVYCPDLRVKENLKKIMDYLHWVNSQRPSIVTVANKKILTILRDNFPDLPVNISIIMRINTIKQVNDLRKEYPNVKRVTLYQAVNRDKELLIKHVKNAKRKMKGMAPIEVELLANEICLYKCPLMKKDYLNASMMSLSNNVSNDTPNWGKNTFISFCREKRISNPLNFLNSCFIRPEDINFYEDIGVDIIKLSGREMPSNYLKLISKAYVDKFYSGSVMDLFPSAYWPNSKPPFINNRNLDGFLQYLWERGVKKLEIIPKKYKSHWVYER